MRVRPELCPNLDAAPPVVVAIALAWSDRRKACFERRDLPLVVTGRQIVKFAADVQFSIAKERALEPEGVPRALGREFVQR